ncbi:MAG: DNA-3-methyladenine glycosylase 2 [Betaproteobacteria bacterium]|nr:3-methyladenine DNA glycosylase 2 [Betaproteobacteria bacterium]MDE2422723.1 DNA-3-methyladenine glycosylase 2 [Betaproteobacteria bacterium]
MNKVVVHELTHPLPRGYRVGDILPYHQRDDEALAEEVVGQRLRKGIIWQGSPALLELIFSEQHVDASLHLSEGVEGFSQNHFMRCVQRMCGLTQPIESFTHELGKHEQLMPLFEGGTDLRFALTPSVFEALSWAVVSQQISVRAAVRLRHRLIKTAQVISPTGLYCYPDAEALMPVSVNDLSAIGFPKAKAETLKRLCDFAIDKSLDELDGNNQAHMQQLSNQLLAIKGIGPWTVNYGLLRGYGYLDGSLHGDIALRRALQIVWQHPDDVSDKQAEAWLSQFSPWRALVAAYLWQYTGA